MKFATVLVLVALTTLATANEDQKSTDVTKLQESKTAVTGSTFENQEFGEKQWRQRRGTVINSKSGQYRLKVVKKPTKSGKIIHLYPVKRGEKKGQLQPKAEHAPHHEALVDSGANKKVEKMMDVSKYEEEPLETESHHYEEEHKEKIKIKHHHHHHHHNHVKTIVKKEPYPVEKIVPKPYPVEKIVEKIIHMPIEKVVHKPFPVPYPVEKIIEKVVHVPKPYAVKEIVEKKIPYPVEKIVEKVVHVHVPKPYPVIKHVHVPVEVKVPVPVEKKVYVPHTVEVEKKVPYPVKVYVPQPYHVEKKTPNQDHKHHHQHHSTHHSNHHYHGMDDHHGYLENKFHEETAASNDQHSLTSVQRQSVSVVSPNNPYHEQMKQFQREQKQLDIQHQNTQHQQEKLNEKLKIYKKFQQKQQYDQQIQAQQDLYEQQLRQMEQMEGQMQEKQKQLEKKSVHGHFGQKMFTDYAKPFYPTEHQHQSILTLQTHMLQDERFRPSKKLVPDFQPVASIQTIPLEQQPLQTTQPLYPVSMDHMDGSSSNVQPVAIEPANDATEKQAFRINVAESEQLPKPEAFTMDSSYDFQPQADFNMFQVYQIQTVPSFPTSTQQMPVTVT